MSTRPIPVTILTGFLGAGKTTLLNYILKQQHGYKFAIIVNEVGKIGIDGMLVENQKEEVIQMNNGCLCCTIRKDLVKGVQNLIKRGGFDYLLIETTGIADPGPVAQTFLNIPQLQQFVRLDSIITVVDAEQIEKQMKSTETAREQIVMADFLLLNKTDLVDESGLAHLETVLRGLNPHAQIFRTNQSQANLKELLDMNAFNLDQKLVADPEFLNELNQRHHHDINSVSFEFSKAFNVEKFENFVQELSEKEHIFRSKGFLQIAGNPRRAIFHGVNNRFTILWDRLWEKAEARTSQLVFIGKHLDEARLRKQIESCLA
ncbi:MAG: Cobalamin synthesis protein [Chthoniobacteraceae bacterium]|nr:Cobalamin synthesis protein [Chthoniobacteraceae bacterium]MDB6171633.1 Cobalamin synthesis protein [Chthoniobacteraceae bacterium]